MESEQVDIAHADIKHTEESIGPDTQSSTAPIIQITTQKTNLKTEETHTTLINGKKHGKEIVFSIDGSKKTIRSIWNYQDNELLGESFSYYPDGKLHCIYKFTNGMCEVNGTPRKTRIREKFYYEKDQSVYHHCLTCLNCEHAVCRDKNTRYACIDQKKIGPCIEFDTDGEVISIRYYIDGKLHGPSLFYVDGRYDKTEYYLDGNLITENEKYSTDKQDKPNLESVWKVAKGYVYTMFCKNVINVYW